MSMSPRVFRLWYFRAFTLAALLVSTPHGLAQDYETLKRQAAQYYSEKSYALAYETWKKAAELGVPSADRRRLDFFMADALWRSNPEPVRLAEARNDLEQLAAVEPADDITAEALESLADSRWADQGGRDWEKAWPFYERALAYWAGSSAVETARERYLTIVWKMTGPPREGRLPEIPLKVLTNALRIATTSEDRARAHYFLGTRYRQGGDPFALRSAGRAFADAVDLGSQTSIYEYALYDLASWAESAGTSEWQTAGSLIVKPDYTEALKLFQRFVQEFPRGTSARTESALAAIDRISEVSLRLAVGNTFLPGSEPAVHAESRNVHTIDLSLYRVDLEKAFVPDENTAPDQWLRAVKLDNAELIRRWKAAAAPDAPHEPVTQEIELQAIVEPGAYVIEAEAGGKRDRELILVTEAAAVLKALGTRALVFICDARTGAPATDASAVVWQANNRDEKWSWERFAGEAGADGLARLEIKKGPAHTGALLAFGKKHNQPIVAVGYALPRRDDEPWRTMVFTDRPAYRPGDTAQWKVIARVGADGKLTTPSGKVVRFEILDPHGTAVRSGEVKLTEFGTAWGEIGLTGAMALGEYRIRFSDESDPLSEHALLRLEEYKLPEFRVTVTTPEENGRRKQFRPGESVEATVKAEYYFGGPVSDADVEVLVEMGYFWPIEPLLRKPRFWMEARRPPFRGGRGIVTRTKLRTGPDGVATVRFDTPLDLRADVEYRIEARVVDSSRREVVGEARLAVSRQGYFVRLEAGQRVVRPQDKVSVKIEAADANGQPVEAAGRVTVTRERWMEKWIDPQGREVQGQELEELKAGGNFPPRDAYGWRLKSEGYQKENVLAMDAATSRDGSGQFSFVPDSAGFYRIAWQSPDADGPPVRAETNVWVSESGKALLGYRTGGVEIIVDPEAPRVRGKAPVLVATNASNRHVLFAVEGGQSLFHSEVLHVEGDAKLVELDAGDPRFQPNVFLSAAMISGLEFFADTKEVAFPPYREAVTIQVTPDKQAYEPGEEATVSMKATNFEGKPVRAEVALAVSDEAVRYIQTDYEGDPLKFFHGVKRVMESEMTSSMQFRPYVFTSAETRARERELADDGRSAEERRRDGEGFVTRTGSGPMEAGLAGGALDLAQSAGLLPESAVAPVVRSDFRATAFWQPSVVTGEDGTAEVKFKFPDSLTSWIGAARAATVGAEFGMGEADVKTTKPLIARLQTPRFLVEGDSVDIAGVVNNASGETLNAKVELETTGLEGAPKAQQVTVANGANTRVDWKLAAKIPGAATLALTVTGGRLSDAMWIEIPIEENGIEKAESASGVARETETKATIQMPSERRIGSERLTITASPSIAATMLDALPYVIEYPYGCVEQTMSRFLPAVVAAKTLTDLGLDEAAVVDRIFGGVDRATLAKTHPRAAGAPGIGQLDAVVDHGLGRLYAMQHEDGSWGWWKGDDADAWMTGYVVWGLRLTQLSGRAVRQAALDRGAAWLRLHLVNMENEPEMQAWMLHALARLRAGAANISSEEKAALEKCFAKREAMTPYGKALLALSAVEFGDKAKAAVLSGNLRDGARMEQDPAVSAATGVGGAGTSAPATASWGVARGFRRWQESGVEATALALQALLAIDSSSDLVEPAVNWLVKNRRGAQWSNTRDSALAILALCDYLARTKQLEAAASFEVMVNGVSVGQVKDARALDGRSVFKVGGEFLRDGQNEISIRRSEGSAPVYYSAQAVFFTREQPISAAGNEIFVRRDYIRYAGRDTLLDGYIYDKAAWAEGAVAASGERVEATLTIEAKNDLEYVVIEDLKPAGLEAVSVRSGEYMVVTREDGATAPVYCELRDRKVAFFVRKLGQGLWTLKHDLRAETPGSFSALPTVGHAMYAPEIRGNGTSRRVDIN
jgi:uncharacterized protein YfaS (alpha-2-macroglobulin family)